MTKAKDIRTESTQELEAQVQQMRKEIFELRNALSSKREDVKPSQIRMKRKDVARILTVLRQRELSAAA